MEIDARGAGLLDMQGVLYGGLSWRESREDDFIGRRCMVRVNKEKKEQGRQVVASSNSVKIKQDEQQRDGRY